MNILVLYRKATEFEGGLHENPVSCSTCVIFVQIIAQIILILQTLIFLSVKRQRMSPHCATVALTEESTSEGLLVPRPPFLPVFDYSLGLNPGAESLQERVKLLRAFIHIT